MGRGPGGELGSSPPPKKNSNQNGVVAIVNTELMIFTGQSWRSTEDWKRIFERPRRPNTSSRMWETQNNQKKSYKERPS